MKKLFLLLGLGLMLSCTTTTPPVEEPIVVVDTVCVDTPAVVVADTTKVTVVTVK